MVIAYAFAIHNMSDLEVLTFFLSMGIESIVDEKMEKTSDGVHDTTCTACEMLVVWIQKQLRQNKTEDQILNYVNEVNCPPSCLYRICLAARLMPSIAHAAL